MIEKIAHNQGRRDQEPNIELAQELVRTEDREGIAEITEGLSHPDKRIASDCIKVLYEVARRDPQL